MPEEKKMYFHIVAMTEQFRRFDQSFLQKEDSLEALVKLWHVRSFLACAQQLSVIAGELKELREALIVAVKK